MSHKKSSSSYQQAALEHPSLDATSFAKMSSSPTSTTSPCTTNNLWQSMRRAFSMDYAAVATTEDDVEQGNDDAHAHQVRHQSTRKFVWIIALMGPLVFVTLWIGKQQARYRREIAWVQPSTTSSSSHECDHEASNQHDALQALKASSVLDGLTQAAVAADHPVCSTLGLQVLEMGGNAVDAAVAVALCLGVANPASSGMGGGAFLLIHANAVTHNNMNSRPRDMDIKEPAFIDARNEQDKQQEATNTGDKVTEVIDCREVAPAAANTTMYQGLPDWASTRGGLSIGVPGELRGLALAHARHGRLAWSAVVGVVHQLAAKGVPVNANLAHEIMIIYRRYHQHPESFPALRKLLTKSDSWDTVLKEGDVLHNPALTALLAEIRDQGADALYTGKHAQNLARDIQKAGGIVTAADIENYRPTLRSPVMAHNVHGYSWVGVPPPSSGGAAIIGAARFLAGYNDPLVAQADTLTTHRMIEAEKHAFAIRMSLSDPAYNIETVQDAVHDLTQGPYMETLRKATPDNDVLPMSQYGGTKWAQLDNGDGVQHVEDADEGDRRRRRLDGRPFGNLQDNGTSHFSIVDKEGNAVSMTTSINTYFGSNVVSPSTGMVLSNTMDDFSNPGRPNYFGLHPSESNYIIPGKKPLSSMSPTMVFRSTEEDTLGDLALVIGASGGPKIISAVLQVIANHLLLGMPLFEAVVYPRFHDQLIYHGAAVCTTENTVLEQGPSIRLSDRTRKALERRGHQLLDVTYEGTVQAISLDPETNEMTAVCDVRKGGTPAGL